MRDAENNALREKLWRRPFTPSELADLQARQGVEEAADLAADAALTEAISKLPDLPLSSNFNSRVLAQIHSPAARQLETLGLFGRVRRLLPWPRLAGLGAACVMLFAAGVAYRQFNPGPNRDALEGLLAVSEVRPLPNAEILADFDAIRMMNVSATADEELLVLMQ